MSSTNFAEESVLPSSPPVPSSRNLSPPRASGKESRQPSVTPRKFRRFFTPRSHGYQHSSARRALYEISAPALNRNVTQSSPLRPFRNINSKEETPHSFIRGSKRQKTTHTPETPPQKGSRPFHCTASESIEVENGEMILSSPCERAAPDTNYLDRDSIEEEQEQEYPQPVEPLKRIISRVDMGLGGQLLNLSIGSSVGRRRQNYVYPVNGSSRNISRTLSYLHYTDWQDHTAGFYTREDDSHLCMSVRRQSRTIPFCTTGCKSK